MAVKSSGQITLFDITDAYTVRLAQDVFAVTGNTSGAAISQATFSGVEVEVRRGSTKLIASNDFTVAYTKTISGVTVAPSFSTNKHVISVTVASGCTGGVGELTVTTAGDSATFTVAFTVTVNKTGTPGTPGAKGDKGDKGDPGEDGQDGNDGLDAISISIIPSDGTVFKNKTGTSTLTAHVYVGGVEKTISTAGVVDGGYGTIKWYNGSTLIKAANTIKAGASSGTGIDVVVTDMVAITCQLEG